MRTKHCRNAMTDPGSYTLRTTEPHLSHALYSYTGSTRDHGIADELPLVVLLVEVSLAVVPVVVVSVVVATVAAMAMVLLAVVVWLQVAWQRHTPE